MIEKNTKAEIVLYVNDSLDANDDGEPSEAFRITEAMLTDADVDAYNAAMVGVDAATDADGDDNFARTNMEMDFADTIRVRMGLPKWGET